MKRYISDLHFFHDKLNREMDCRGFASLEEMHAHMIAAWNQTVSPKDEVFILGDFSVGKAEETNEIVRRLKGELYLIRGNHDYYLKKSAFDRSRFHWIQDYAEIHDEGRKVILSHYPIFCYNGQNRLTAQGEPKSAMLYGHLHDTFDEVLVNRFIAETRAAKRPQTDRETGEPIEKDIPCLMINCFCMFSEYRPLSLREWIELDRRRRLTAQQRDSR
ncbi:metallophosphoesterase family protein [Stomatobaculum longum]|jgi:putative phosphoesterase|uniref:metallophosphoesterase family protein n=1 Tax=Stomatobaculum longum TaxID=796942 RepID=UPI0028D583EB|nr:metallophosphoesterase [Stomatobaculum longum]